MCDVSVVAVCDVSAHLKCRACLTCILVCLVGDMQLLKFFPMYAHLNLSCSKRGGAKGLPYAQACHVGCV